MDKASINKIVLLNLLLLFFSCKETSKEIITLQKEDIKMFDQNDNNLMYSKYGIDQFNLKENILLVLKKKLSNNVLSKDEIDYLKQLFYTCKLDKVQYNVNGHLYLGENYITSSFSTDNILIMKNNVEVSTLRFQKNIIFKKEIDREDFTKIYFYKKLDSILISKQKYKFTIDNIKSKINNL